MLCTLLQKGNILSNASTVPQCKTVLCFLIRPSRDIERSGASVIYRRQRIDFSGYQMIYTHECSAYPPIPSAEPLESQERNNLRAAHCQHRSGLYCKTLLVQILPFVWIYLNHPQLIPIMLSFDAQQQVTTQPQLCFSLTPISRNLKTAQPLGDMN